jgi:peroxiredoxin Q/BCP
MSESCYPSVGSAAPAFEAEVVGGGYAPGARVRLSDLAGGPAVLYFYPKDNTPGCTKQACGLRDGWAEVGARAKVFGVSPDSAVSHGKFIKKFELPFPLLVDENHRLAEAFGVWVEKSMYGKKYFGVERTTFVIDAEGKIQAVLPKVKPEAHLGQLLDLL